MATAPLALDEINHRIAHRAPTSKRVAWVAALRVPKEPVRVLRRRAPCLRRVDRSGLGQCDVACRSTTAAFDDAVNNLPLESGGPSVCLLPSELELGYESRSGVEQNATAFYGYRHGEKRGPAPSTSW